MAKLGEIKLKQPTAQYSNSSYLVQNTKSFSIDDANHATGQLCTHMGAVRQRLRNRRHRNVVLMR